MGGRRSVPRALLPFLIVLMAAAGCAGAGCAGAGSPAAVDDDAGGSGDAAGSEESNSSGPASTREHPPQYSDAELPGSTLASGGWAVAGVLGGYCWSSGSGGTVLQTCVDAAYPLVPGEGKTLAVPAGSGMVFDYGGEEPPNAVRAKAEPFGPGDEPAGPSRPLATGGSGGGRVTIPAEVPAGVYVVDVFVQVPEGDASYYFRAAVEGHGAAPPAAGGPEDRSG